jgi:hypothetical protein
LERARLLHSASEHLRSSAPHSQLCAHPRGSACGRGTCVPPVSLASRAGANTSPCPEDPRENEGAHHNRDPPRQSIPKQITTVRKNARTRLSALPIPCPNTSLLVPATDGAIVAPKSPLWPPAMASLASQAAETRKPCFLRDFRRRGAYGIRTPLQMCRFLAPRWHRGRHCASQAERYRQIRARLFPFISGSFLSHPAPLRGSFWSPLYSPLPAAALPPRPRDKCPPPASARPLVRSRQR